MNCIYDNIKKYRPVLTIVAICCFCVILLIAACTSYNGSKAVDLFTESSMTAVSTSGPGNVGSAAEETEPEETKPVLIGTPIMFSDVQYIESYNIKETEAKIEELSGYIQQLTEAIDSDMYEFSARYTMQLENSRLLLIDASYKANLEALTTWKSEYYYAYETLDFFYAEWL